MSEHYVDIGDIKYQIDLEKKCLVNKATKEPIPVDEPLFIIRGKDKFAHKALTHYALMVSASGEQHKDAVLDRSDEFREFAKRNEETIKIPDTEVLSCIHCGQKITRYLQSCNAIKGMCASE